MTKIYLVRHGESIANKEKLVQGHLDLDLSDLGYEQAEKIGHRLKNEKFDLVYSSDLKRAINTAGKITQYNQDIINVDKRLREISRGLWTGKKYSEVNYDILIGNFFNRKPPGGENVIEHTDRVKDFFKENLENFQDKNVLIVSHAGTIKSSMKALLDWDYDKCREYKVNNTGLTIIDMNKKEVELNSCHKHLGET